MKNAKGVVSLVAAKAVKDTVNCRITKMTLLLGILLGMAIASPIAAYAMFHLMHKSILEE